MAERPVNLKRSVGVTINPEDADQEHCTRFQFELTSETGVVRKFLIDVPLVDTDDTDVWCLDHIVEVGDSPEDGFATYTPVSQTIGANPSEEKAFV